MHKETGTPNETSTAPKRQKIVGLRPAVRHGRIFQPVFAALPHPSHMLGLFAWLVDVVRYSISVYPRNETYASRALCTLYSWLPRASARLDRLFTRWKAGKYRPAKQRARTATAPQDQTKPATPQTPRDRLPSGQGWLFKSVIPDPMQGAPGGFGELQTILADTEIQAFCKDVAEARRIFRPLCTAYGLPRPDYLKLPPRARKQRPSRAKPKLPKLPIRDWEAKATKAMNPKFTLRGFYIVKESKT
jgi:hypothetical protein